MTVATQSTSEFSQRLRARLHSQPPNERRRRSDFDLNPDMTRTRAIEQLTAAAVLVPLVVRHGEYHVILTVRANHLPSHAGQVSFPGGKVDPRDADLASTALRETQEEIGLHREQIRLLGYLDLYETRTGYSILPVVGEVVANFELKLAREEVEAAFEVPVSFLMNPENHQRHQVKVRGALRNYYAMPYEGQYIWGATAGIIKAMYDLLYDT